MVHARNMVLTLFLFSAGSAACSAERILWAKGATHFGNECPPSNSDSCTLAHVLSPNRKLAIEVHRDHDVITFEIIRGTQHFRLQPPTNTNGDADRFVKMEILWSPDSSAVSLAWNETAITFTSQIYVVRPDGAFPLNLGGVMADLIKAYPPCVGDPAPCAISPEGRDYNYLTVGWAAPHTVALMGEVGESSSFGRNMGKVNGYEVDADSGKILHVLKPKAFKQRWQSHMGWNFNVRNAEGLN